MQSSVSVAVVTFKLKHIMQCSTGSSMLSSNTDSKGRSSEVDASIVFAMRGVESCSSAVVIGSVLAAAARGSCGSVVIVV